jgi:deazaflavin-dependent oxidoreductase (nitroreductase family)
MKIKHPVDLIELLMKITKEHYCYLTTTGRISGNPHEIEIWFGINDQTLYLLSGGGDKSDWVRNLLKKPEVAVRIAKHRFTGTARIVSDEQEDMLARRMLATKYQQWREGRRFSNWARTGLPVAIDLMSLTGR